MRESGRKASYGKLPGKAQASLSMEFSRLEYWNGKLFPSPQDLPKPGIFPIQALNPSLHIVGGFFTIGATREPQKHNYQKVNLNLNAFSIGKRFWKFSHFYLPGNRRHLYINEDCLYKCNFTLQKGNSYLVFRLPWWLRR